MKIIGHRGASADAPENTLEALQLAWEQGVYGAECDIARTRDGRLVLMHDDSTGRTAHGGVELLVEETEWSDLQDLDVGSWKGERWQGVRIPLLEEVLRAIPDGKHLYIEIKSGRTNRGADLRVIDELAKLLVQTGTAPEKITFISFDHNFLDQLKKRLPHYRAAYLTSYLPAPGRWPDVRNEQELEECIARAVANNIDGLDLESSSVISRAWVEKIHARGLTVTIWSYSQDDTLENARRYAELGVDFLTTNSPGVVLAALTPPSSPDSTYDEGDYLQGGRLTPLGVDYLARFKCFSLFNQTRTALLFTLFLPLTIPLALLRLVALIAAFGGGFLLKSLFSIELDRYPKLINLIYFLCLGVYVRVKDQQPSGEAAGVSGESTVIVTNHHSRFDAMLLANLHQADATYRAAARVSFFGRLLINSGLCHQAMVDGLALDTKEGRSEWRRRLQSAYPRPMLLFPEGRVVQRPMTIMTFQNHLLQGEKVRVICRRSRYRSYFLDHTQIEIPFFKRPYSGLKHKLLWDSLSEVFPFLISLVTIFETEIIATIELQGDESLATIDELLYAPYLSHGFRLVSVDPQLAKKLLQNLYA